MIAPDFNQWLPHSLHTLIHSGILLAAVAAVLLNWFFNGAPTRPRKTSAMPATPPRALMARRLIRGAEVVVTMDAARREIAGGEVLIDGGKSSPSEPALPPKGPDRQ